MSSLASSLVSSPGSSLATTLRQVDPSSVDTGPFWAAVVAGHPDASYVLLPPAPPPAPPDPTATEEARRSSRAVVEVWRRLAPVLSGAGAGEPAVGWFGVEDGRRLHVETALSGIGRDAGARLLARLGALLAVAGWRLRPQRCDDRSWLIAAGPDAGLEAAAGEAATVVSLRGTPQRLGPQDARLMCEEVRSWL